MTQRSPSAVRQRPLIIIVAATLAFAAALGIGLWRRSHEPSTESEEMTARVQQRLDQMKPQHGTFREEAARDAERGATSDSSTGGGGRGPDFAEHAAPRGQNAPLKGAPAAGRAAPAESGGHARGTTLDEGSRIDVEKLPRATPLATLNSVHDELTETVEIPITAMLRDPEKTRVLNNEILLFTNTALLVGVELKAPAVGVSIWAHGTSATGEWPELHVWVGGVLVADVLVTSETEQEYYVPIHIEPGNSKVVVEFTNDTVDPVTKEDRNVFVREITVTTQVRP